MNNTSLVGRLTKDPEVRYTPNGVAVANFTLAVNRTFKDQNGDHGADFISCVSFRKQAENLANYQKKGNQIGITGRIQTGRYENNEGKTVYTTDVVAENIEYLEPKSSGRMAGQTDANSAPSAGRSNYSPSQDPFKDHGQPIDISDADLPF